ncbi:Dps family protein [Listeria grayi]|uniref:Dps family protein n=1 Tax=Listeria grayi TaxID=1641 RepID=UPI00162A5C98|nr:Dps family protein [Listeria grayi]MBC1921138.1 DNA starvation/stationary phase protection protein [Listeria grayi]
MKTINSVDTKEFLNHQVANLNVFTVKIHQIHWYMKGHNFFTMHEKMDDLYSEFDEQMDEVAERLLAIGGKPFSSLKEFLENASIEEAPYTKEKSMDELIGDLVSSLELLRDEYQQGIKLTEEEGDDVTNDMLIGYKTEIDKHIWMYKAFLGKASLE